MFQQGIKQNSNQQASESLSLPSKKESLHIDDLTEADMKNLIENYKNTTGGGSVISRYVEDYIKFKEPSISAIELLTRIHVNSAKELFTILEESSKDKKYKSSEFTSDLVQELNSKLDAPERTKYLQVIKDVLGKESLSEYLIIRSLNEDDQERLIHVLSSPDFKKFKTEVQQKIGIDVSSDLILVEKIYQDHLKGSSILNTAVLGALDEVKKIFPEIKIDSIRDITTLNYIVNKKDTDGKSEFDLNAFREKLQSSRSDYDFVTKTFDIKFKSLEYVLDMHELNKSGIEIISDPKAKDLYDYLKNNYPSLNLGNERSYMFLGWNDGFAKRYAEPIIKELQVEPETLDAFLKIFEKDLSNLGFNQGLDQLTRGIYTPLEELVADPRFRDFIDTQLETYPELKKAMDIEVIAGLTKAFENQYQYQELQKAIQRFETTKLPYLKLEDSMTVLSLLNTVKDLNFDKIVLGDIKQLYWGVSFDRPESIQNIKSPEARELYNVLIETWNIDKISLDKFNFLAANPEALSFFKSEEVQYKIKELNELYDLGLNLKNKPSEVLNVFELRDFLLENFDTLSDPKVVKFFDLYNPAKFKPHDSPSFTGNATDLKYFSNFDKLKNVDELLLAGEIIQKKYNIPSDKASEYIFTFSDIINSNDFEASYQWVKDVYFKNQNSINNEDLFNAGIVAYKQKDLQNTVLALDNIGIERNNANLSYVVRYLHKDETIRSTILDPDFQKFSKILDTRFYNGKKEVSRILEYVELYNEAKGRPERLEAVLSDGFQDVTKTIGQLFHVATERPSTLLPMIKAAENFDKSALEGLFGILKLRGEKIYSNDAMFLVEITKDQNLRNLLENRSAMLTELSQVYETKSFPRSQLDQLSLLPEPSEISEESFRTQRIKEREEVIEKYTERPDLEEFSNLQLLRLTLINRSLQNEDFRKKLGEIAKADISDKTTERGGNIKIEGEKLSLVETVSMAHHDGAFANQKYGYLIDGIGTFHLHALEVDESKYSGPSGWLGSLAADIGYVDQFNSVDTVFTAIGHPLDSDGNAITSLLRMNADTYFIDKRDPNNPKLRIVDFGEIIVPFSQ